MLLNNGLYLLIGALFTGSAVAGPAQQRPKVDQDFDPSAIIHAIDAISASTEELGETVVKRPVNIFAGVVLRSQCNGITNAIKKGIKAADESAPLNMTSAFHILVATENLVGTVNKTMTAVIDAHKEFLDLPLVPFIPFMPHVDKIVLKKLKKQSKLSKEFGGKTMAKVPSAGREDGQDRLNRIYHSFAMAIDVYENKTIVVDETGFEDESVDEDIDLPLVI